MNFEFIYLDLFEIYCLGFRVLKIVFIQTKKQKLLTTLTACAGFIIFLVWLFTFNLNKKTFSKKNSPQIENVKQKLDETLKTWRMGIGVVGEQIDKLKKPAMPKDKTQ